MGIIIYGTRVFTKFKGYYGERKECPACHKVYQPGYVKITNWAHIDYIPLFPTKRRYFKMCPICGRGFELTNREAKQEMMYSNDMTHQNLEVYAKHILANRTRSITKLDSSYEVWVKDLFTGEETCIGTHLAKANIKDIKKERGLRKIRIENV